MKKEQEGSEDLIKTEAKEHKEEEPEQRHGEGKEVGDEEKGTENGKRKEEEDGKGDQIKEKQDEGEEVVVRAILGHMLTDELNQVLKDLGKYPTLTFPSLPLPPLSPLFPSPHPSSNSYLTFPYTCCQTINRDGRGPLDKSNSHHERGQEKTSRYVNNPKIDVSIIRSHPKYRMVPYWIHIWPTFLLFLSLFSFLFLFRRHARNHAGPIRCCDTFRFQGVS